MAVSSSSPQIVPPVEVSAGQGSVNPAALTIEQLARALGVPIETIRRHVEDGAPTSADGRVNLVHYAAWLNKQIRDSDGD